MNAIHKGNNRLQFGSVESPNQGWINMDLVFVVAFLSNSQIRLVLFTSVERILRACNSGKKKKKKKGEKARGSDLFFPEQIMTRPKSWSPDYTNPDSNPSYLHSYLNILHFLINELSTRRFDTNLLTIWNGPTSISSPKLYSINDLFNV